MRPLKDRQPISPANYYTRDALLSLPFLTNRLQRLSCPVTIEGGVVVVVVTDPPHLMKIGEISEINTVVRKVEYGNSD